MARTLVKLLKVGLSLGVLGYSLIAPIIPAYPALAIANPDSGPYILQVDAYQNLKTSGDALIIARIRIPYAVAPTEPVAETFYGRLLTGSTEVQSTTLYSYPVDGYNYNTIAFYAATGIVWSGNYTVELSGSPTLSWTAGVPSANTTSVNWHTSSSSALSKAWLGSNLIGWATTLSGLWTVALTTSTASGTVLSSYGLQYFTSIIPYLGDMCPQILPTSQSASTHEDTDHQNAGNTAIVNLWPFDFSGISDWLGLPDANALHILLALLAVIALSVSIKLNTPIAIIAGFSLAFMLAIPGFLHPMYIAATIFVAALGVGLVFILGKAS